jgi:hypothetical protein
MVCVHCSPAPVILGGLFLWKPLTLQRQPGRTNMSGEIRVDGWLGTTDNVYRAALGLVDENGARLLLQENGVKIPDDVPVRHNVRYAIADRADMQSRSERYNRQFAYPYQGPWYDVPPEERRWCDSPAIVAAVQVVRTDDDDFIVIATSEKGSTARCWYEMYRADGNQEAEVQRRAQALVGTIFDRGRMRFYK